MPLKKLKGLFFSPMGLNVPLSRSRQLTYPAGLTGGCWSHQVHFPTSLPSSLLPWQDEEDFMLTPLRDFFFSSLKVKWVIISAHLCSLLLNNWPDAAPFLPGRPFVGYMHASINQSNKPVMLLVIHHSYLSCFNVVARGFTEAMGCNLPANT